MNEQTMLAQTCGLLRKLYANFYAIYTQVIRKLYTQVIRKLYASYNASYTQIFKIYFQ